MEKRYVTRFEPRPYSAAGDIAGGTAGGPLAGGSV
jgi:hypothetical protein